MPDKSLKDLTNAVYKIAENSPKIQKDVKDIRDAICGTNGILESIYSLNKTVQNLTKKGVLNALTNNKQSKNSDYNKQLLKDTSSIESILKKILNKVENIKSGGASPRDVKKVSRSDEVKKINGLENLSKSIEIVEKLKNVKLKDLLFGGRKLKQISKVIGKFQNMFKHFKDSKEVEGTMNFANSSIELMKKLSKIALIAAPAKSGAKAVELIFLGDGKKRGGLLKIFRKLNQNRLLIKRGALAMKDIKVACTSMFLSAIMLTGIAVVGIPAMIGALFMKGVVWLLIGTFKLLSKSIKPVIKGSLVLLIMSTSIITFSLGLALMGKAVHDMKFKDVGIILASIVGVGVAVAGIGLLAIPITIGSLTMLLLGASLGIFALSIMAWKKLDTKAAMGNIKLAVEGLKEVFGLELGKGDDKKSFGSRLGGGIIDFTMAILNFGKSFFIMGSVLLAGISLGMLYHGLKRWANFNDGPKAVGNIKKTISGIKEVFGLEDKKPEGLGGTLKALGGGLVDIALALLQSGKALVEMGTITLAVAMSDLIRVGLIPWNKYDPSQAITNMGTAVTGLKEVFGLKKAEGFGKITSLFGGLLDMGVALMQSGTALVETGTITIAAGMSISIKKSLSEWTDFNSTKPIVNLSIAISGLKRIFGLSGSPGGLFGRLKALGGGMLDMGVALMQSGKALIETGTITTVAGMSVEIQKSLKTWENYNSTKPIANLSTAISGLKKTFGLTGSPDGVFGRIKALGGGLLDMGVALMQSGKALTEMGTITIATGMGVKIKNALQEWTNFRPKQAIDNLGYAVNKLKKLFGLNQETKNESIWDKLKKIGGGMLDMGITLLQSGQELRKMGMITIATGMAAKICESLKSWEYFKPKDSIENLSYAITELKKTFGLTTSERENTKIENFGGGILDMGLSLLKSGKILRETGVIAVATGMSEKIASSLQSWKDFNDVSKATTNLNTAMASLKKTFGFDNSNNIDGSLISKISFGSNLFDLGLTLMQGEKCLITIGAIATSVGLLDKIRENLIPWETYKETNAVNNIMQVTNKLLDIFGFSGKLGQQLDDDRNVFQRFGDHVKNLFNSSLQITENAITGLNSNIKLSALSKSIEYIGIIKKGIDPWNNYDPTTSIKYIQIAVQGLDSVIKNIYETEYQSIFKRTSSTFKNASSNIKDGLNLLKEGLSNGDTLKNATTSFDTTIKAVNSLDITKASTMTEMFKSFTSIGIKPFDKFTSAVNKFSESCEELIDSLNSFEPVVVGGNGGSDSGEGGSVSYANGSVNITNTKALASAIADAIKALPVNVKTNISDVKLVLNNETGRRFVITLDN